MDAGVEVGTEMENENFLVFKMLAHGKNGEMVSISAAEHSTVALFVTRVQLHDIGLNSNFRRNES